MKNSFNELSYQELLTKREELRKSYRDLRFNMVLSHVDNPLQKRVLRRRLARLNTIIHEYDLGIRKHRLGEAEVEEQKKAKKGIKRVLTGRVVSNKMQKTIVVAIERRKLHPLYKKYLTLTKKIKAHDEGNHAGIGDLVRVIESRPISKEKCWRLAEILEKAK